MKPIGLQKGMDPDNSSTPTPLHGADVLAQLAADVHSAGREADVFDYWCEVGDMIAALAIQAGGRHVGHSASDGVSLLGIPEDSACCALCQVCDVARTRTSAHGTWLTEDARAMLTKLLNGSGEHDPVAGAERLLAQACVASEDMTPDRASQLTKELLESVVAVATELETSSSAEEARGALARDHLVTSQTPELPIYYYDLLNKRSFRAMPDRDPDGQSPYMIADLLGEPALPRSGGVERALEHCSLLAQGRLLPGSRMQPANPRYRRSSLRAGPAWPKFETPLRVLCNSLERHFKHTWWLATLEEVSFPGHGLHCVDFAGWRRDHFADCPVGRVDEIHGDYPVPPDWICDELFESRFVDVLRRTQSIYQRAGVTWHWTIDVEARVVRVLRLVDGEYRLELVADGASRVAMPPFESVEIDLRMIFPPRQG